MTTTHRIGTTAALILSLAAAGAPAASASPSADPRRIPPTTNRVQPSDPTPTSKQ